MASLQSAQQKLENGNPPFPIEDLPRNINSVLWERIGEGYGLTLSELAALQNTVESAGMNASVWPPRY